MFINGGEGFFGKIYSRTMVLVRHYYTIRSEYGIGVFRLNILLVLIKYYLLAICELYIL